MLCNDLDYSLNQYWYNSTLLCARLWEYSAEQIDLVFDLSRQTGVKQIM